MGLFNITCKKATELIEKEKFDTISWVEKLKLKFHLSVCKACHTYQKNSTLMDSFFKKTEVLETTENKELKNKILSQIENSSEKK